MSVGLMLISGSMFVTAMQWPFRAAIFPMTIAVFVFVLASIEVFMDVYLKQTAKEESTMDFKLAGGEDANIDEATVTKRVINISVWILLFFALILLVGFPVATPLYFVMFLKIQGKESWKTTVILSAVAWIFFYGLFVWILHIPFAEGWVQDGLRLLGMLN